MPCAPWFTIVPIPMKLDDALRGTLILDGGLGTELERAGCDVTDRLWSARVLMDHPAEIAKVHASYLAAGAQCITTASYQVSYSGFAQAGLSPSDTEAALQKSVRIAREAREAFRATHGTDSLIAASVGPYGAALADGSEFHGNYGCTFQDLVHFHRQRLSVLADSGADLLGCETIPSLEEAEAILECVRATTARAWFSFSCADGQHTSHGEQIAACARRLDPEPQVVAIGVNCTAPKFVTPLIAELRSSTRKPIVVYPNAGRKWDAVNRRWLGAAENADFATLAQEWFDAGARWIGGCCGTTPDDICRLRQRLAA